MKPVIISDPYPRSLSLIFTKQKLQMLKRSFVIITPPEKNKRDFYEKNISKATFIIGQPDLDKELLIKAKKLKAIFNVESNFMDNMDYNFCFQKGIHVLATSPVFSKPVAELALGLTLSLIRNIHGSHQKFIESKEVYGLDSNKNSFLLTNKKIGIIGLGDLSKSLIPLLKPFSDKISVYDPWVPNKIITDQGMETISLNKMFSSCDVIYILAAITKNNQSIIDKKLLNKLKKNSCLILMSRAAVMNFKDFYSRTKKGDIFAALDVFPTEPVNKNDPIRKLKNVLFSAHRAGALSGAFTEMGDIVYEDMMLIMKNLPPRLCKRAERETVGLLRSKPISIN
ncbi:NAD(P)-binding domain-containing protein [Alphaproteobacteria bacterium]|nr:NAD(P)-binding domain-containing protein [Alphaproteobacteria bacterium]MDB9824824.1 NAD(P)-binding domain-containing protein [Alphaproteobacteria bacterium]